MYDFFSVDYDYGDGVHIHSMCRQVTGCADWTGEELVYERGTTNCCDRLTPRQSPIPAGLPRGEASHFQEQIDVLHHVRDNNPVDQARAVAESSATAVMGRIAAYTGKKVTWDEVMGDPSKAPDRYNLTLRPTAEDFETGNVEIPEENAVPHAGV
jgi:hypothetical protein